MPVQDDPPISSLIIYIYDMVGHYWTGSAARNKEMAVWTKLS